MRGSKRPRSKPDGRGHCTWELRVPTGGIDPATGKRRYATRSFRGTEPAADTALAELVAEVVAARRASHGASPSGASFSWLLEQWLEAKRAVRQPNTVARYEDCVRLHIAPFVPPGARRSLGATPYGELTVAHFEALYGSLTKAGFAPGTVNQVHSVCRGCINWARKRGWWTGDNPAVATERPALKRRTKTQVPRAEEVGPIIDALFDADPDIATALWFCSSVGARRSMALGVLWRDVDFVAGTVDLIGVVVTVRGRLVTRRSNKQNEDHTVCLDPDTMKILAAHRARCEARAAAAGLVLSPDSWVFSFEPDGSAPMHPDTLSSRWRSLADAHGLDRARLHDLRHMVATSLLSAGVPVEVVSQRLGHSKVSVTQDIYSHVFEQIGGRDAANKMGALLAGADPDKMRRKAVKKARKKAAKEAAKVVDLSVYRSA